VTPSASDFERAFRVKLTFDFAEINRVLIYAFKQLANINFEWGGMTEEMRKAMQARTRGELGRGISGESGAGTVIVPETESGGAPGGASMAVPKKYSFWVGVKLSQRE